MRADSGDITRADLPFNCWVLRSNPMYRFSAMIDESAIKRNAKEQYGDCHHKPK
jgi:hypothetical protein